MWSVGRPLWLHFVGIGGVGMSGIALLFAKQGYKVTGSDLADNVFTRELKAQGVCVFSNHTAAHVEHASVVVRSSAIRDDNPEIQEALRLRIPVVPRAEMLGELMRGKTGIAVAGTHGKTTTTSMLANLLTAAGRDPTLVIGGRVDSLGGHSKWGTGPVVVAEADESDGSFLCLPATYAVITNIDQDHLDHYKEPAALEKAFVDFVGQLPFYGLAVVCAEDSGVRRNLKYFRKPYVTYGFRPEWDLYASNIQHSREGSTFEAHEASGSLGRFSIRAVGDHHCLNALGAIGVARAMGIEPDSIRQGLMSFQGVKRRFECLWKDATRTLIEDYAHHPTEILATLKTARLTWKGSIRVVFQPHRYSRTQFAYASFLEAFDGADGLTLLDIYAAGESPIPGIDSPTLASDIAVHTGLEVHYAPCMAGLQKELLHSFKEGEMILCLGAGSIHGFAAQLAESLHA